LVVLGVFISVINVFLSGELTERFVFKALTVFIIAGAVFAYYLYDIRRDDPAATDAVIRIFGWASLVIVVAAFIASWFFVESPATARARRLDQALLNNISSLETAVNNYYDRYKKLPDNLSALTGDTSIYLDTKSLLDPDTLAPIVYKKLGDQNFELCAIFRLDSKADNNNQPVSTYPGDKNHYTGYQCVAGTLYTVSAKAAN
jgi:vacuolar-type H+-ATPase subunit I/STV1